MLTLFVQIRFLSLDQSLVEIESSRKILFHDHESSEQETGWSRLSLTTFCRRMFQEREGRLLWAASPPSETKDAGVRPPHRDSEPTMRSAGTPLPRVQRFEMTEGLIASFWIGSWLSPPLGDFTLSALI
ncbi:hypothetical protein PoB_003752600 [Plakobranchus ocellatus]|uniref:Uncharacterized protein n=1 Tax=Plakobranchus ocellatus TaxID=259542 RepID=A0AAV4AIM2_9GAST|nr:hypothetical protein PoB_003752600 [Plakobranchus ocellatus]